MEMLMNELKIFTETVAVDEVKSRDSGATVISKALASGSGWTTVLGDVECAVSFIRVYVGCD